MEFDFSSPVKETEWVVDKLIPKGHLCIVLAQAGVGKSLLVEDLAIHITFGVPFCEMPTIEGNVLLIDQDTPTDVFNKRLIKFAKAMQGEQKYKLFTESMNQYSLSNGSLVKVINNHPSVEVIIIDCLHSICGKYNPNHTSDMGILAQLKQQCLTDNRTIIMNHHISEKINYTVDELMVGATHNLAMGNSAIIQQADTYYIVGATAENGYTNKMYLRPVAKRVTINSIPLILKMTKPTDDSEKLEYGGVFEPEFTELEQDILTLFREVKRDMTIKEVYEETGHAASENTVRKALMELEKKGRVVMNRKSHNLFKYRLP